MSTNLFFSSPVIIDNSKERESLLGFCRSFYWKLSRDFRQVRKQFIFTAEGFELRTKDSILFLDILLILDLALVSFEHYSFLDTYIVLVKEF